MPREPYFGGTTGGAQLLRVLAVSAQDATMAKPAWGWSILDARRPALAP